MDNLHYLPREVSEQSPAWVKTDRALANVLTILTYLLIVLGIAALPPVIHQLWVWGF